jgi:hypothetical protein
MLWSCLTETETSPGFIECTGAPIRIQNASFIAARELSLFVQPMFDSVSRLWYSLESKGEAIIALEKIALTLYRFKILLVIVAIVVLSTVVDN